MNHELITKWRQQRDEITKLDIRKSDVPDGIEMVVDVALVDTTAEIQIHSDHQETYSRSELKAIIQWLTEIDQSIEATLHD